MTALSERCDALGIEVRHDAKGLTHAWNRELEVTHCAAGYGGPACEPGPGTRDCMHCRPIPGYAQRYIDCGQENPY